MYTIDYIPILIMLAMAVGLAMVFVLGSVFLGPALKNRNKLTPFECGHPSEGNPNRRFAVKFYGIALLFILFDLEAVFLYPWAAVYGQLQLFALLEMGVFLFIFALLLAYVWSKGGLEWD